MLTTINTFDAIGNETLVIQENLSKMGFNSQIYAENIHHDLKNRAKKYTEYKPEKDDIIIYHHNIGTKIIEFLTTHKPKTIMIHHSMTAPEFFSGIDNIMAEQCKQGIKNLDKLKNTVNLAVGDSEFNRLELEKKGFKKTSVLPILLNLKMYQHSPMQSITTKFTDSVNIIFVGRIAPNKKVDQLIGAFHYYNSNINSNSNLFLIGGINGIYEKYNANLEKMIRDAKIKNIHFIDDADEKKLVTYFSIANAFVTMSEHEGFCVPLVESMYLKVPIIANNSTAIPYTLGNSGLLVNDVTFEELGELIDLVTKDEELRKKIIEKQTLQFKSIYYKENSEMLSDLLNMIS